MKRYLAPLLVFITLFAIFRILNIEIRSGSLPGPQRAGSDSRITLIATGDIIPARSVNAGAVRRNDFTWPYLKTQMLLSEADLTFINLESPLISNCPVTEGGMIFCGDERNLEGLLFAGVDVASFANNHAGNYGLAGIENTTRLLQQAGIQVTGRDGPVFKEVKGVRFAFLGYNDIGESGPGLSSASDDKIISEVTKADKQADVVVVAFHWGVEYVSQPSEKQRELAHLAVDSGADLIIGNHPHWIQPVETYKGKTITYAHGNLIFDQMWSQKTREGVIGRYTFNGKDFAGVEFIPVIIEDYGQPRLADDREKERILQEMQQEGIKLRGL